jgi:uncharacterized membrane protein YvbJ
MAYCPKCGAKVTEEMTFCPQCGAALKATTSTPPERYRSEKGEKQEKQEKGEKNEKREQPEKYEKQEFGVLGPLIGGLILILVGFMFFMVTSGAIAFRSIVPYVLVIVGLIVIVGVIVGAIIARGRNPKT